MTILTVGAGQQFARLSDAIAASHDGDTIQVQAGTYVNDFATIDTKISIVGVGGMAKLVATEPIPNGKAILVTNTDVTLDHIEFTGAEVHDNNGAGIRYQGGNLVVTNCYFHDNQDGILAGSSPTGTIDIRGSEFAHNGDGSGYTHGIYVNKIASLHVADSYFHDTVAGHHIKSRADHTVIENSRLDDGVDGTASYSIDLPNGGAAVIRGNTIVQGAASENNAIIHYGGESAPYAGSSLLVQNNVIENFRSSAVGVRNASGLEVQLDHNQFYNVPTIASGPFTETADSTIGAPVAFDTSSPWLSTSNPEPTPAPAPAPAPAPVPQPSGDSGTIELHVAEDAWHGDAQFTVVIDGHQVGGTQTAHALHAAGQWDDIVLSGGFDAAAAHKVEVSFVNDAWGGTAQTDRNLYIDWIEVNGQRIEGENAVSNTGLRHADPHSAELDMNGTVTFDLSAATPVPAPVPAPAPVPEPSPAPEGADVINLRVAQDAWHGDAQFAVMVDGKPVGGIQTVHALHSVGQWDDVTLTGDFGDGPHKVAVSFVNDAWGGTAQTDRNLYVDWIEVNGQRVEGEDAASNTGLRHADPHAAELDMNGTVTFDLSTAAPSPAPVPAPAPDPADVIKLHVAQDAWRGDAKFTVTVDGQSIGGVQAAHALHSAGQWDDITLTGDFGDGPHKVAVSFVNDAWGGTAQTDRNLYLDWIEVNGQHVEGEDAVSNTGLHHADPHAAELDANGTVTFDISDPAPTTAASDWWAAHF